MKIIIKKTNGMYHCIVNGRKYFYKRFRALMLFIESNLRCCRGEKVEIDYQEDNITMFQEEYQTGDSSS